MAASLFSAAAPHLLVGSLSSDCAKLRCEHSPSLAGVAAAGAPSSSSSSSMPCRASSPFKNLSPDLHHQCSRRLWNVGLAISAAASVLPAHARDRRNKVVIPIDDYLTSSEGIKYYDFVEGKGPVAGRGQTVLVHFDCMYRGIDAVSSRESKLLGGNRIIAQPYEFVVGSIPGKERKRDFVENTNGLLSAQAAPKPPPALYSVAEGMHVGGKRRVVVSPEIGFGSRGSNEIPPGATFQMDIELLEIKRGASN